MLAIDGHVHLALDALRGNRDVTQNVLMIRQSEAGMPGKGRGRSTVSLPDMRRGHVGLIFALICVSTDPTGQTGAGLRTPEATYAYARGELAYYRVLEEQGLLRSISDPQALASHVIEWEPPGENAPPIGYVLAMEGCDPVLSPDRLEEWFDAGLRVASISHYGMGRYAAGTGPSGGVTDIGRELLREMERLSIALDVAHLAEPAFYEAVDLFHGPICFTHGGTRAVVPMWRSLSDEQLRILIDRGGVIGISMDCWQISKGWIKGQSTPDHVSLENVVDNMVHICELAGNTDHVAIGTDLDGGYGTEQTPRDVDSIADLQKIPPILRRRGYSEKDVAKVMHGNWMRLLNDAWS